MKQKIKNLLASLARMSARPDGRRYNYYSYQKMVKIRFVDLFKTNNFVS